MSKRTIRKGSRVKRPATHTKKQWQEFCNNLAVSVRKKARRQQKEQEGECPSS